MAKSIHQQLIEGLDVRSRADGTVHTIRGGEDGKQVVAEICVGQRKVRVNFKQPVKAKGLTLDGKSKSWSCGIVVDEANVSKVRELLASVAVPKPKRSRSTAQAA